MILMIVRRRASYRFIINFPRRWIPLFLKNAGHQKWGSSSISTRSNMLLVYISSSRPLFIFIAIFSQTSIAFSISRTDFGTCDLSTVFTMWHVAILPTRLTSLIQFKFTFFGVTSVFDVIISISCCSHKSVSVDFRTLALFTISPVALFIISCLVSLNLLRSLSSGLGRFEHQPDSILPIK